MSAAQLPRIVGDDNGYAGLYPTRALDRCGRLYIPRTTTRPPYATQSPSSPTHSANKTGLDGDGQDLVGKALGFSKSKPPLLAVNKLQTETERSVQTGLLETLEADYSLIRNPRSHERYEDDKKTADAVIFLSTTCSAFLASSTANLHP